MKLPPVLLLLSIIAVLTSPASAVGIWINELHYDDAAADINEFVEVAVRSDFTFTAADFAIQLYNGSGTSVSNDVYSTVALSGFTVGSTYPIAGDLDGASITLYYFVTAADGIQNGSPDGLALVNTVTNTTYQFLSYEGTFIAHGGVAAGLPQTDILVSESSATLDGSSLEATGSGADSGAFVNWVAVVNDTPGTINAGQTFAVPEPTAALLGSLGILGLLRRRR